MPLAQLVIGGLPFMDSTALMTLVDRWRPETHTFHLRCGEATVTLQDFATILGLPIDDTPVCGPMSPGGWRESVGAAIDI
jgi:aryl carrier-like protein